MHHCADTFAEDCQRGLVCIVSIRHDGLRVATAEVKKRDGKWQLKAIKGPMNRAALPKSIIAANNWLGVMGTALLNDLADESESKVTI